MNTPKYLQLQDIPFAAFMVDCRGEIVSANDAMLVLSGYKKNELLALPVNVLFPYYPVESDDGIPVDTLERLVTPAICQLAFVGKSVEQVEMEVRITKVNDIEFVIVYRSSEQQQNVCQVNTAMDKLLDDIEQPFWEWYIDTNLIYFSAQFMALLGYKKQPFTGPKSFWEKHLNEKAMNGFKSQIQQHFSGLKANIDCTFAMKNKAGQFIWVNVLAKTQEYKDNKPYRVFGSMKDITQSQALMHQVKEQKRVLGLVEQLPVCGYWHINLDDEKLFWSPGLYKIFGIKPSNYRPSIEETSALFLPSERGLLKKHVLEAIENKQGFYFKAGIKRTSGQKVKIEAIGDVELNGHGQVVSIFGLFRDITKSEHVFEKLKLLAMVNYTNKVPIFFIDDNDNVVYQDLSPQQGSEKSALFNYINFSITDYLALKKTTKRQGQLKKNNISFDNFITVFDLSVTYESDEGIFIWIVENVTDKFRKDQQQIISNRLALLGNTFGNVSHDINNVLGVALGAIEMLELKFSRGDQDITSYIERVKNAIDKGKNVTERLLAFTRKPTVKVVEFDPIHEIKENKYLFKQLLIGTIKLRFELSPIHCLIRFPQGEFINILLNIVLNAQDAIQEKELSGEIIISAKMSEKKKLEIHIKDSGIGIAQENLSRIFDPFYSSKSINKGNGIGLANVYSTMYKHNGLIQVEGVGELGGAHFTLIFNCRLTEEREAEQAKRLPGLNIKNKRILILDDEVSISEFVALYLESEGAVTTYVNDKEQLLACLASEQYYDIFITDMILPDLSGKEAVELVKMKFADIKIFSISGYIAIEDKKWPYPVLRKPFNSKELAIFLMG